MSKGWECPRCGEVYGPSVEKCTNVDCKKKPAAATATGADGEVLGDPIDDDELHDMIYNPSVRQFADGSGRKKRRGGGGNGGGDQSDGSSGIY